jgi:hypothetical protein
VAQNLNHERERQYKIKRQNRDKFNKIMKSFTDDKALDKIEGNME